MKTQWLEKTINYDGTQLRSLYAYLEHGILGDSIIAWRGPCEISFAHMVDGEDLLAQSPIRGSDMLHFIVEVFRVDLLTGVSLQRLLAASCLELLRKNTDRANLRREGDDIYWGERKFSISIATVSPASTLIHFAVNCRNQGTPVPTCALEDFAIDPKEFATELITRFAAEYASIEVATKKVRWVN